MANLLSVDEALERILSTMGTLPAETVPLLAALGRVLAAPVVSEISLPPFANSSMDGFAVRSGNTKYATAEQPALLRLMFDIPAGSQPEGVLHPGQSARIMTGAPLPEGADAIVPVEATDQEWKPGDDEPLPPIVKVYTPVSAGAYVRPVGEDIEAGQTVLVAGTRIRAAELGVLAALGIAEVQVVRRPRVAIIGSGDELVDVHEPLTPGKIRDINSYTLFGLVTECGGEPIRIPPAKDTLDDVRRSFNEALSHHPDLILSSAGVSVGAFDVVRTIMDEMGKIDFWRINLRPGKPLAFGEINGIPFFGLPGNPVSAMVTFDVFVRPTLLKLSGSDPNIPTVQARLREALTSDGRRSYIRVKLSREDGQYVAESTGTQSSGALTSMVQADGLLIIPENVTEAQAGSWFQVRLLRSI